MFKAAKLGVLCHNAKRSSANVLWKSGERLVFGLKMRIAHQPCVYGTSSFATFRYGPNDKRLASSYVAGGKHTLASAHVVFRLDIATGIKFHTELGEQQPFFGTYEADCQQRKFTGHDALRPRNFIKAHLTVTTLTPLNVDHFKPLQSSS